MSAPSAESSVALVTGAGSGIGERVAHKLAAAGFVVGVADLAIDRAERVADALTDGGGRGFAVACDVADEASVDRMVRGAAVTHGRLTVLVNNAGIGDTSRPTVDKDLVAWQRVMDVNVRGVFLCCRRAGREMLAAGHGSIINIASVFGMAGVAGRSAYCPSKAAVVSLTQTLATEWGADGIRVNAVAPGWVRTPLFESVAQQSGYDLRAMERRVPLGRLGTPGDVANIVAFLASDESAYVNGATLVVDGGMTASLAVPDLQSASAEGQA